MSKTQFWSQSMLSLVGLEVRTLVVDGRTVTSGRFEPGLMGLGILEIIFEK
jgi:hypothetical protein